MAADEPWAVGKRRWRVWIGRRDQAPDPSGAGILETLVGTGLYWANVVPNGPLAFYAATQVDTPVTHKVWTRWLGYVDQTHVVLRDTVVPGGQVRRERFRIRRVVEDQGRKRFTMLEVELEQVG